jgi:hypothetical protein
LRLSGSDPACVDGPGSIASVDVREVTQARSGRAHIFAIAICVLVLFTCYTRFARTFARDSDDAAFVLEAQDILRGNLLLHGWNLPPDTFYASITPWYVIGTMVTPDPAELMNLVPSLIYAVLVGLLLTIVWNRSEPRHRAGSILAILAVVALPAFATVGPPTATGAEHTTTVLFVLATFYLLSAGTRPVAAAISLALATIGDPMAIFIGTIPLVVAGGYRLYIDRGDRRCLVAAAAAILIPIGVCTAISRMGGFFAWGLPADFVAASGFPHNLALFGRYSLALFGVEWPSRMTALLAVAPRAAMLVLVLAAICIAAMDMVKRSDDLLAQLCAVALAIDVAAYVTSTQAGGEHDSFPYPGADLWWIAHRVVLASNQNSAAICLGRRGIDGARECGRVCAGDGAASG